MFFVRKKKYDELEKKARELEKTIDILVKQNTELKAELTGEIHNTTPLCKGCVNCIDMGLGYFYCKLNRTCNDYIDCIEE
ncbi:MAG: bZIP transcription factor [Clostridia bacterium]|nr:bZIP transcription factor [Clostridia bacterium]